MLNTFKRTCTDFFVACKITISMYTGKSYKLMCISNSMIFTVTLEVISNLTQSLQMVMARTNNHQNAFFAKTLNTLPEKVWGAATIENPSNKSEIIIFSGRNIYVYCKRSYDIIKTIANGLEPILCQQASLLSRIESMFALNTRKPDTIIIVGSFLQKRHPKRNSGYPIAFYSVFNTKSMTFENISKNIFDDNGKYKKENVLKLYQKCIYNFSEREFTEVVSNRYNGDVDYQCMPFWGHLSRFHIYKHYLIVNGQRDDIIIYDIENPHCPHLISFLKCTMLKFETQRGAIVSNLPFCNDNVNENDDNEIVKLLTFGANHGGNYSFLHSFCEYEINFNELEKQYKLNKSNKNVKQIVITNIKRSAIERLEHFPKILKTSDCGDDTFSKRFNLNNLEYESKKYGLKFSSKDYVYKIFGCAMYHSRYLIIYDIEQFEVQNHTQMVENEYSVDPKSKISSPNLMISFDFKIKEWKIVDNIWPNGGVWRNGGIITQTIHDGIWLNTFGGVKFTPDIKHLCATEINTCFGIKLSQNMDWSIERLLWIAYLKNNQNCKLSLLPKDIILFVLTFFKKKFIFAQT